MQRLVPGIVGISAHVDAVYLRELQQVAIAAEPAERPLSRLRTVTVTLDYARFVAQLGAGRPDAVEEQIAEAAVALERAGADFVAITSGTGSTLAARARERVALPFLGLEQATWDALEAACGPVATVGLLSTRHAAAAGVLHAVAERHGATVLVPPPELAAQLDELIFEQLAPGAPSGAVVDALARAAAGLAERGAEAVVLGNTDMTLVAEPLGARLAVPLVDAARAHARAAGRVALGGFAPPE